MGDVFDGTVKEQAIAQVIFAGVAGLLLFTVVLLVFFDTIGFVVSLVQSAAQDLMDVD